MAGEVVQVMIASARDEVVAPLLDLARQSSFSTAVCKNGVEALEILSNKFVDVVLCDLQIPGMSGLDFVKYVKENEYTTEVILLAPQHGEGIAGAAMKAGAYDCLALPVTEGPQARQTLAKAMEKAELVRRLRGVEGGEFSDHEFFGIIGRSLQMRQIFKTIESVAPSSSNVLILGESGTGKELVARAIHLKSPRFDKPFVVINCSAIPANLLEAELFGYKQGAFTGAVDDRMGLFAQADGGTVFLDEIGDVPPAVQVKLLRVLQEGEVRPLGATQTNHVDVRIVAATHQDLYASIKSGKFREDLFYRLNVINIALPNLKERIEDVPLLAYFFLRKYAAKLNKAVQRISVDALTALQEYGWPGNVREMENAMERGVVMTEGDTLMARDLPPKLLGQIFYLSDQAGEADLTAYPYNDAKERALNAFNRSYIGSLLQQTGGNVSMAAARAGVDRSNFKKIIRRFKINTKEFKKGNRV